MCEHFWDVKDGGPRIRAGRHCEVKEPSRFVVEASGALRRDMGAAAEPAVAHEQCGTARNVGCGAQRVVWWFCC